MIDGLRFLFGGYLPPKGPLIKAEKIARHLSKYMTKDLIFAHRPDKKHYWRSEFDLPEVAALLAQGSPKWRG